MMQEQLPNLRTDRIPRASTTNRVGMKARRHEHLVMYVQIPSEKLRPNIEIVERYQRRPRSNEQGYLIISPILCHPLQMLQRQRHQDSQARSTVRCTLPRNILESLLLNERGNLAGSSRQGWNFLKYRIAVVHFSKTHILALKTLTQNVHNPRRYFAYIRILYLN